MTTLMGVTSIVVVTHFVMRNSATLIKISEARLETSLIFFYSFPLLVTVVLFQSVLQGEIQLLKW